MWETEAALAGTTGKAKLSTALQSWSLGFSWTKKRVKACKAVNSSQAVRGGSGGTKRRKVAKQHL